MAEDWHGTFNGYNHHHCRCEPCRLFVKEYKKQYRKGVGAEVVRTYRRAQYTRHRETENARRKELKLRRQWNETPVATMPYYRFLAQFGQEF